MSRKLRYCALAVVAALGVAVLSLTASAAPAKDVPPHPIVITGSYGLLNLPTVTVGTPVTGSTGITDQDGNKGMDTWVCVPTLASPVGVGGKLVDFLCAFEKRLGPKGEDRIQSIGVYSADLSNLAAPWQNGTVSVTGGAGLYCGMSGQIALSRAPSGNIYTWTITYAPLSNCS